MSTFGIRFYPTSIEVDSSGGSPFILHGALKEKCSNFDYIFRCVYHLWSELKFVDEEVFSIWSPDLSEENQLKVQSTFDGYMVDSYQKSKYHVENRFVRSEIFEQFGGYISEFEGNGIALFDSKMTFLDARKVDDGIWNKALQGRLPEGVLYILHNWDGVYWEIYTQDKECLDTLMRSHANDLSIPAYWVNLHDDFPSPRGRSPEEVNMKRINLDVE